MSDPVELVGNTLTCHKCGATQMVEYPIAVKVLLDRMRRFDREHAGCSRPRRRIHRVRDWRPGDPIG